jgi:hypothetical protein
MSVAHRWPNVTIAKTPRDLTANAGSVLLRATGQALRIIDTLAASLRLKRRARGLSDAQFAWGIAESVALGASCLDDLDVARGDHAQTELRGFEVPTPKTAGVWLRRFTIGHIRQLDRALREIVRRAFELSGVDRVTLDFDSTYIFCRTKRRQGADRTYKKRYALHPLLCFDAETGAAVHAKLRRGRAAAATGIKEFLTETLRRIPAGVAIRARLDSGFYAGELLTRLEGEGVTYLCGVRMTPPVLQMCRSMDDPFWTPCPGTEGEVSEFGYRMHGSHRFRRFVVKRIPVNIGEQMTLETGSYHYFVTVTNDHVCPTTDIEAEHRRKAQVEQGVRELKENFGMHALRKHAFMANWAWILLTCLGHNLCCWTQTLGALEAGRREGTDLRAKRLRYRFLHVPAMLVRTGRRLVLKLTEGYLFLDRFLVCLDRLRALPGPAG